MTDTIGYYRQRVATELEQARRAVNPEAINAHSLLAKAYLALIDELDRGADPDVRTGCSRQDVGGQESR